MKHRKNALLNQPNFPAVILVVCSILLVGCGEQSEESLSASVNEASLPTWAALFEADSLLGEPELVDCVLSGGTRTNCVALNISAAPTTIKVGPWCPRNVSDGPDAGGIWLEAGKVYDVDGEFVRNLATFYGDAVWQLFDESTGAINVTDSRASCEAAARPDVDEAYYNHCVECQVSYLEEGKSQTFIIPVEAVPAAIKQPRIGHDGVGIAFSGVRLDAPAPTDAILSAHTLAPFDDCGGHVNPHVGYHMHAVTDCLHEVATNAEQHAPMLGIALDGYAIHSRLNPDGSEPDDLDSCRGHNVSELGYHYHAGTAGSNAILGCHSGETGCVLEGNSTACDATQNRPPGGLGGRPPPPRERG